MKINSYIDNLDEKTADQLAEAARLGRNRFEVVLDRIDGDHIELELHFRLAELNPTRAPELAMDELERRALYPDEPVHPLTSADVVTTYRGGRPEYRTRTGRLISEQEITRLAEEERRQHPVHVLHVGSSSGSGPEFAMFAQPRPLDVTRLAELLARFIELAHISPQVLGIPGGPGELSEKIEAHLRKDTYMGKHGDGKPADTKPGGSKDGGAHEKPGTGTGKGGK